MRVTTKGRYALRAISKLAMADTERPVPIKRLASEENISPEFLEQIFFRLKQAGIITSVRGPGGGFSLNYQPQQITAKAVFEAVGEGLTITPCANCSDAVGEELSDGRLCERQDFCHMHAVWRDASRHINSYFSKLTVQDILETPVGGTGKPSPAQA